MRLFISALLGLVVISLSSLPAATLTWDGNLSEEGLQDGGGTWNLTATNRWFNPTAEPPSYQVWDNAAFDLARFGAGGALGGTVTLGTGISAGGLIFSTGGYTLSGQTLTLGGSSTPVIQTLVNATIQSILAGNQGFTKTGSGNLTLSGSGTSSITGNILISEGTLTLSRTGVALAGQVEIGAQGSLVITQNNQLATTSTLLNSGGIISYGNRDQTLASYTQTAGGQTGNNSGTWTITGALTFSGGSTLTLNSNGQWSAGSVDLTGFSTTTNAILLGADGSTRVTRLTVGSGGLRMDGQNVVLNRPSGNTFGNELLLGGDITSSGNSRISTSGATPVLAEGALNQLTLPADSTRHWNVLSDTSTLTLPLGGTGTLNKTGPGTLLISGIHHSVNTGAVRISEGTLSLSKTAGVNAVGGDIIVNGGSLVWVNSDQLPNGASIFFNSGPSLDFAGRNEEFANYTQIDGVGISSSSRNTGIVVITGTASLAGGGAMTVNSGGRMSVGQFESTGNARTVLNVGGNVASRITTFTVGAGGMSMTGQTVTLNKATTEGNQGSELLLNGPFTGSGTNNINLSTGTFGVARLNLGLAERIFNITAGSTHLNVPVIGAGGIRKEGAGTLRISVAAEFTGETVITSGRLELTGTGSIASSSAIRVEAGAVLDVSALSGGFSYAPVSGRSVFSGSGQVTGNLTLGGTAVMQPGGTVLASAAPNLADVVAGTLAISGNLALTPSTASTILELDLFAAGLGDKVTVGGNLVLNSSSFIEVLFDSQYTPTSGDSWELMTWQGLLTTNGFSTGTTNRTGADSDGNEGNLRLPDLTDWGLLWEVSPLTGGSLVIAIVPEPGRAVLLGLSLIVSFFHRRRR